jgi:hypothetical protein
VRLSSSPPLTLAPATTAGPSIFKWHGLKFRPTDAEWGLLACSVLNLINR